MANIQNALEVYNALSMIDRLVFYATLSSRLHTEGDSLEDIQTGIRMSEDYKCSHCGSTHFVKNGRRPDGTQRYLCRDCKKSFLISTNSIVSRTHKTLGTWKKYFDCLMDRKTLKESAQECGISMGTAFNWRHKILDALQTPAGLVCLDGTVEADETFFPVSYKGNHGKSSSFTMPREAHKRGGSVHTKGLSDEQVCVLCAVNDTGTSISKVGKTGKVSSECVSKFFTGRIRPQSVLCTDNEKAYIHFAGENRMQLVQMDTGMRTRGSYGIQRINAYHSKLKEFIRHFHGVSTKYLDNYLIWHNLVSCSQREREETEALLFGSMLKVEKHILCRDLPARPALPSLV